MLNICDFRCVFKVDNVRDRRRSTGRLFQARGTCTVLRYGMSGPTDHLQDRDLGTEVHYRARSRRRWTNKTASYISGPSTRLESSEETWRIS